NSVFTATKYDFNRGFRRYARINTNDPGHIYPRPSASSAVKSLSIECHCFRRTHPSLILFALTAIPQNFKVEPRISRIRADGLDYLARIYPRPSASSAVKSLSIECHCFQRTHPSLILFALTAIPQNFKVEPRISRIRADGLDYLA